MTCKSHLSSVAHSWHAFDLQCQPEGLATETSTKFVPCIHATTLTSTEFHRFEKICSTKKHDRRYVVDVMSPRTARFQASTLLSDMKTCQHIWFLGNTWWQGPLLHAAEPGCSQFTLGQWELSSLLRWVSICATSQCTHIDWRVCSQSDQQLQHVMWIHVDPGSRKMMHWVLSQFCVRCWLLRS